MFLCERWKNSNQTYQSWLAYTLGIGSLSKPEEWVRAIVEQVNKKFRKQRIHIIEVKIKVNLVQVSNGVRGVEVNSLLAVNI